MQPTSIDINTEAAKINATPEFLGDNGKSGDARLALWRVGPVRVVETNADSVWEDNEGFMDLLAEIEGDAATQQTTVRYHLTHAEQDDWTGFGGPDVDSRVITSNATVAAGYLTVVQVTGDDETHAWVEGQLAKDKNVISVLKTRQ